MKTNRIMFALGGDQSTRRQIIEKLLIRARLAYTPATARNLITDRVDERILTEDSYYVAALSVADRLSPSVWRHLYTLANRGIFVAVGVRQLPSCADLIGEVFTLDNLS